jgi:serine protease Do
MKQFQRRKLLKLIVSCMTVIMLFTGIVSCSKPSGIKVIGTPYQSGVPQDFSTAVASLLPSAVMIEVQFSAQAAAAQGSSGAAGTGWVLDTNGHIVTNNHIISGAKSVTVVLQDGTQYTPTAIQADAQNDLAVLKIDAKNLKPATLGDSSKLVLGQPIAALGNAMNLGIHVTAGIISNLNVSITVNNANLSGLIETDATINPGNSGGILFTLAGELIGIPNAGLDAPNIDPENFGYAISINTALPVINKLASQLP